MRRRAGDRGIAQLRASIQPNGVFARQTSSSQKNPRLWTPWALCDFASDAFAVLVAAFNDRAEGDLDPLDTNS